jgi:membrane-associated phospholipid phosphatase
MKYVRQIMFYVGLDLVLLLAFALGLLMVWRTFGTQPLSFGHGSTVLPPIIMGILVLVSLLNPRRDQLAARTFATLRDWSPLILMMIIYDNFHDLTRMVRPEVVDESLRHVDERLFSVEPTLWMQRIVRPWLTEYMSFAYATLFGYPIVLLTLLYMRGKFFEFREFGLALSLAFYFGLVGYMLVPAVGPRYMMAREFSVPLEGYWLTARAANAWESITRVDRDCFPSLHTALSTIALVYLRRNRSWLFWVSLPLVVSLWFSTVYLRYHYTIDVFAGFVLAAFCCLAAPALMRWYYANKLETRPAQVR